MRLILIEQRDRETQGVVQLPDVARPVVVAKTGHHFIGHPQPPPFGLDLEQGVDQTRQVIALAQRRQGYGEAVDTVVQVLAEAPCGNLLAQVAVGCAHQRDVDRRGARATNRGNASLLQHAQQAGLQLERHVADFVEEQGAAICLADFAYCPFLARTGKCPANVAEQLRFDEVFGNRRAVERHERAFAARTAGMKGLGEHLFANPRLPLNQDRNILVEHAHGTVDRNRHAFVAGA